MPSTLDKERYPFITTSCTIDPIEQIHAIISESPNYACYSAKSQLVLAQYLASQQEEAQTKQVDSNNSGTAVLSSQRQQETPEERRSSVLRILEGVLSLA